MQPSWTFGRPFGIPLAVHLSWPPVFAFVTWSLAAQFFPVVFPEWPSDSHWGLGVVASLLLFGSVLAHELGHALVARWQGLPVRCVTLFVFGGIAEIESDAKNARDEFVLAAAGPAMSVLIAAFCVGCWYGVQLLRLAPESATFAYRAGFGAVALYLAVSNGLLVLFNLIPAYPLDGARMLRALLWHWGRDLDRATAALSWLGQVFGYLGVLGGLLWAVNGALVAGLWLIALGWFLSQAARGRPRGHDVRPGSQEEDRPLSPTSDSRRPPTDR